MSFLVRIFLTILPLVLNIKSKQIELKYGCTNNSSSIYLYCRGTSSKAALIGNKLNLIDKEITHCGIGFFNGNGIDIYNVIDKPKNNFNALIIDNYYTFTNVTDINYFSIWEHKIDSIDLIKIKNKCIKYKKKEIDFDYQFKLDNDSNLLYCSEFCASVFNECLISYLQFCPTKLVLENSIYKSYLKCDTLIYYPVDFFERQNGFKKIHEEWFKEK